MLGRVYGRSGRISLPNRFQSWKYLLPSVLVFVLFGVVPVLWVLYQSMFTWSALVGIRRFVAVENYNEIISSSDHMLALGRTLIFVIG